MRIRHQATQSRLGGEDDAVMLPTTYQQRVDLTVWDADRTQPRLSGFHRVEWHIGIHQDQRSCLDSPCLVALSQVPHAVKEQKGAIVVDRRGGSAARRTRVADCLGIMLAADNVTG